MTMWMFGGSVGIAVVALCTGYTLGGYWSWSLLWILLGGLWWGGRRRWRRRWASHLVFLGVLGAATGGVLINIGKGWMLLSVVAALMAWDLDHFLRHLEEVPRIEQEDRIVRAHLQRLVLVSVAGLSLGSVALLIQVRLSLGVSVLLGILTVVGLQQFLAALRRESD